MPAKTKKKAAVPEKFLIAANAHCLRQYATSFTAGTPRRLSLPGQQLWIFPVLFTSPGYGEVGEVGVVAVDARTGQIAGSTPRAEVTAAAKRLSEEKRDELEAAFLRARTS